MNTEEYWEGKLKEASTKAGQQALSTYLTNIVDAIRTSESKFSLYKQLSDYGLLGSPDDPASRLENLASATRVDLALKTARMTQESLKQMEEAADPIQAQLNPCWEILRDEWRKEPRDWPSIWNEAANRVMWLGVAKNTPRMIATKESPIWNELGTGFSDSLGNPYPPFFFGSGMGWEIVTEDEVKDLEFG